MASGTVLDSLRALLISELSAVHQYLAHEAFYRDAGYAAFADLIAKRGDAEREHADELLARIYELGGTPDVASVQNVVVGNDLESILKADFAAEDSAVKDTESAAVLALSAGDVTTFALLQHIAAEEVAHRKEIRGWMRQANDMTAENFLSTMTGR